MYFVCIFVEVGRQLAVIFCHNVEPKISPQVVKLDRKFLYLVSHFVGPKVDNLYYFRTRTLRQLLYGTQLEKSRVTMHVLPSWP